jgi:hypothetical protein
VFEKIQIMSEKMLKAIGPLELLIILVFMLLPFILCVIALVDILRSEFERYNKIVWLLVVILLPFAGAILYFVVGKKTKIQM